MRLFAAFLCIFLLMGCAAPTETAPATTAPTTQPPQPLPPETVPPATLPPDPIEELLETMTFEERVGQLFLARCDDGTALADISQYHPGGFVLFGRDFKDQTPGSMREKLLTYQEMSRIPLLLAVDEEGGTVNRVSSQSAFRSEPFSSPRMLYAGGGLDWVLTVEAEKCELLKSLGLNVNLAPVCDVTTDPNAFMYKRSLGLDPDTTGQVISEMVSLMHTYQLGTALKHFPGYGNNTDTHTGIAVDRRSLAELEEKDLVPFRYGIEAGCGAILVSHTIVEALDPELPATLSPAVHRYLREEMNFQGVIITDDLVMQAITDSYGAGEAAVLAVLAGNDLLCVTDYAVQYEAVLAAVMEGRISFDMLNNAVYNVLEWKAELGLI